MNDLRFSVERWIGVGNGEAKEIATRGLLRIDVGETCLTRNDDTWSQSTSDYVHVSMYPVAFWLAANWWRICFEAPIERRIYDWASAHELGACGAGYLWPHIEFSSDGETVTLESRPSKPTSKEPVRYLSLTSSSVRLENFQNAAAEFIEKVIARLRKTGFEDSELERLWTELGEERANPDLAIMRKLEASMRLDPDEADPTAISTLEMLARQSGADAAIELAGALPREALLQSVSVLRAAASDGAGVVAHLPRGSADMFHDSRQFRKDPSRPAWQRGMDIARALRTNWKLNHGPLTTVDFEARLGLARGSLVPRTEPPQLSVGLAVERHDGLKLLLHARNGRSRRFEVARLLGDYAASFEGAWHPATELRTSRQKLQRAFAAEFLCPVEGLNEYLGGDRSDDAIFSAAEEYDVSERVVVHQIENHLAR
jgi:hypothetical protein